MYRGTAHSLTYWRNRQLKLKIRSLRSTDTFRPLDRRWKVRLIHGTSPGTNVLQIHHQCLDWPKLAAVFTRGSWEQCPQIRGAKGTEWSGYGEGVQSSGDLGAWESVVSSLTRRQGRSPDRKDFSSYISKYNARQTYIQWLYEIRNR